MNINADLIAHYSAKKEEISKQYNTLMEQLKKSEEDFSKNKNSTIAELNMLLGSFKEIEMLLTKLSEKNEEEVIVEDVIEAGE